MKKAQSTGKNSGIITLELLIAFAVIVLCISGVIMVVFSNQSISIDLETNNEAISKAQKLLEDARAESREDFDGVVSFTTPDGIYTKTLEVVDPPPTPCKNLVHSVVSWTMGLRTLSTNLSTFFTDIAEAQAQGADCPSYSPEGGWRFPNSLLSREAKYTAAFGDTTTPQPEGDGGTKATDLDVLNKIIYVTATSSSGKDTFFIFDATDVFDVTMPPITGSLKEATVLNAIDVAYYPDTGKTYAFVAGYKEDTLGTCGPGLHKPYIEQLQVYNVTDIDNPVKIGAASLDNISPCLTDPAAYSIYYYDEKVYLGTSYLLCSGCPAGQNNELQVFDVSDPTNPTLDDKIKINRDVNDIIVKDGVLYLATGPGSTNPYTPLRIYDLNTHNLISYFNHNTTQEGTALFLSGNRLYLGLEKAPTGGKEFYILNKTFPLQAPLPTLGYKNLGLHSGKEVAGIQVAGNYAFIGTNDSNPGFFVLNIKVPSTVDTDLPISTFNYSNYNTGVEFEDGLIYTSNNQNDSVRIIRPSECADKIDNDSDSDIDKLDPDCHSDGDVDNSASYDPDNDDES
jgi:hypothetical protein